MMHRNLFLTLFNEPGFVYEYPNTMLEFVRKTVSYIVESTRGKPSSVYGSKPLLDAFIETAKDVCPSVSINRRHVVGYYS